MSRMLARNPVYKFMLTLSSTNITTAAWLQLVASMPVPTGAVEIFNGSNSIIKISSGAAGLENASELPYYVLPGGSSILLPIEFAKGSRLSAKAADVTADVGSIVFNFFA